jgi:Raf kinase inhibitor-like YbhB/YbcL family protein
MNTLLLLLLVSSNSIMLSSTEFANNGDIPNKYSCEGRNVNPPLSIIGIPGDAVSLALIVDDPDADKAVVTHWILWNIDPATSIIAENSKPGTEGKNERGNNGYMGPCPPSGKHGYHFTIYALDKKLSLPAGASKSQLVGAMEGHILASGELIGMYKKTK